MTCPRSVPFVLIALVTLGTSLLAGCPPTTPPPPPAGEGEGEGEGEGDPTSLPVQALAAANAAFAVRCRAAGFQAQLDPAFDAAVTPDEAQLTERARRDLDALAADPQIVVNLSRVNACLAFLADSTSACAVAGEQPGEDCRGIFVGQVAPDGVCARSEECAFAYGCTAGADQCGTCTQRSGEGSPCNPGGCLPGLACIHEADVDVCRAAAPPAPAAGDACAADADCGQALITGLVCRPSQCTALTIVALGDACDTGVFAGAGTRICADGLTSTRCGNPDASGVGTCLHRNFVGDACGDPSQCDGLDAFCEGGTCSATGHLDDACDTVVGGAPPCTRSLRCESDGVCRDSLFFPPLPPTCGG